MYENPRYSYLISQLINNYDDQRRDETAYGMMWNGCVVVRCQITFHMMGLGVNLSLTRERALLPFILDDHLFKGERVSFDPEAGSPLAGL